VSARWRTAASSPPARSKPCLPRIIPGCARTSGAAARRPAIRVLPTWSREAGKMETQARYTLVGAFVLAATLAVFAFVYWLHNTGGLGDRQMLQVRFQSSISGLLKGSSVLFNGIRVGEVTDITLSADAPKDVLVTIAVDKSAPVRSDTVVNVDFQGLTGAPVIELSGGAPGAAAIAATPDHAIPLL